MADNPRIEELRRRVQKDPASIAFAQLAEECRRAEQYQEAVDTCRAGLELHPEYLSARVTLGRALIELAQLDEAQIELELVLSSAPENLAAIRGLAEIFHRRGSLAQALKQYRAALALARNDPDLERTVTELAREIEPKPPAPVTDGLSFEEMANEFLQFAPPPPPRPAPEPPAVPAPEPPAVLEPLQTPPEAHDARSESSVEASPDDPARTQAGHAEAESGVAERRRAQATIAELDQMLDAIHVARDQRRP
jgi:tetratricopeptide (TPR) repeat protein